MTTDAITLQTAFQLAVSLIAFLGGFLLKTLFSRIRALEVADTEVAHEVSRLREELPRVYVLREDFKSALDGIFSLLRRIEDKLDSKVDKL